MASTGTTIQTEIDRLKKAKSDIKTAIINKGGTISDIATIDTYATAIDGISTGGATGGGVPIVPYGFRWDKLSNNETPYHWYSNIEDKLILESNPSKRKGIIIELNGYLVDKVYPSIIELPKDNTFHLWNDTDITIGVSWDVPGIYIIHRDLSETKYSPSNFIFATGNTLRKEEGLTFSNVDFSDCIMIGVGRVAMHVD